MGSEAEHSQGPIRFLMLEIGGVVVVAGVFRATPRRMEASWSSCGSQPGSWQRGETVRLRERGSEALGLDGRAEGKNAETRFQKDVSHNHCVYYPQ